MPTAKRNPKQQVARAAMRAEQKRIKSTGSSTSSVSVRRQAQTSAARRKRGY